MLVDREKARDDFNVVVAGELLFGSLSSSKKIQVARNCGVSQTVEDSRYTIDDLSLGDRNEEGQLKEATQTGGIGWI